MQAGKENGLKRTQRSQKAEVFRPLTPSGRDNGTAHRARDFSLAGLSFASPFVFFAFFCGPPPPLRFLETSVKLSRIPRCLAFAHLLAKVATRRAEHVPSSGAKLLLSRYRSGRTLAPAAQPELRPPRRECQKRKDQESNFL